MPKTLAIRPTFGYNIRRGIVVYLGSQGPADRGTQHRHDHHRRSTGDRSTGSGGRCADNRAGPPAIASTNNPKSKIQNLKFRERLGWRITAPGLILTALLAAATVFNLQKDIANPLGGWLWAATLAMLLLTFVGAPGWPRGGG